MDPHFVLQDENIPFEERARSYEYFRRWESLIRKMEEKGWRPDQFGWGHTCPELIIVLNRRLEHAELQFLYRMIEALHTLAYYTYDKAELQDELACLPDTARVIMVGKDIPDLAEFLGDSPDLAETKKRVWKFLREKARPIEVF